MGENERWTNLGAFSLVLLFAAASDGLMEMLGPGGFLVAGGGGGGGFFHLFVPANRGGGGVVGARGVGKAYRSACSSLVRIV